MLSMLAAPLAIDLGPRAGFVLAAYVVTLVVLAALVAWLVYDGTRQRRRLAELEARGVRRRSKPAHEDGS